MRLIGFVILFCAITGASSSQGLQEAEPERTAASGSVSPTTAERYMGPIYVPDEKSLPELPRWSPNLDREKGLRLWDCIHVALQNNRPLQNARDSLRIAQITLRERQEEFGNIYQLGSGANYDENLAHTGMDRYSFSMGGAEGGTAAGPDGSIVSRRFTGGGSMSLGARTTYHSTEVPHYENLLDANGNPVLDPNGDPTMITRYQDIRWFSEANLAVTQPLLEGAGDVATTSLRAQELDTAATNLDLERFLQSVITDVVRSYLAVQRAISLAQVGQDSYLRALSLFKLTQDKAPYVPADVSPVQLFRAEQQVTSTQQQFMDAKNNVESSLIDLRLTLGLDPNSPILIASTETVRIPPLDWHINKAVQYAFGARPDLRALELAKRQQEIYFKASENALLPNLDFTARMGVRDDADDLYESYSMFDYQDVGANLRMNIPLNLPSDKANFQRSQILVRQAQVNLEQKERVIANEVDDAYRSQQTLFERISVLQRNEELARKTFETLTQLAEYGQIDPFDAAQAQNDLTSASASRVRAEIDYVIAVAAFEFAIGKPISEMMAKYSPASAPPAAP